MANCTTARCAQLDDKKSLNFDSRKPSVVSGGVVAKAQLNAPPLKQLRYNNYALVAHATATATALGEMLSKMCHKSSKFLNHLAIIIYI